MKALIMVMASLLFSSEVKSERTEKNELTDSFSDIITSVSEEEQDILITFNRHAATFKVPRKHPQFKEIKAKLEKAQKIDQKVRVIAIIPSMLIKDISA